MPRQKTSDRLILGGITGFFWIGAYLIFRLYLDSQEWVFLMVTGILSGIGLIFMIALLKGARARDFKSDGLIIGT